MSLKRWSKVSSTIVLALSFHSLVVWGADAQSLWNEGMERFLAQRYAPAIESLKKYLDQYPGEINALDARFYLGQSYWLSKKPKESIPYFQAFIEGGGKVPQVNEARQYLGSAYLDSKKYTEAYLVSEELLIQPDLSAHWRAKALLLRAHAQNGLKQSFEAEKSLMSFQTIAANDPELEAEVAESYLVTLNLKAWNCDQLPSSRNLPEDQLIDQMSRKGMCVLEMGSSLRKASGKLEDSTLKRGSQTLESSWLSYQKACDHPPLKTAQLKPKQKKAALQEITTKIKEGCRNTTLLLQQTLSTQESLKPLAEKLIRK